LLRELETMRDAAVKTVLSHYPSGMTEGSYKEDTRQAFRGGWFSCALEFQR